MQQEVSKKQFAQIMGWRPSYVTELAQADRLVLSADGKRVDVEASKARIAETADLNRVDVQQRHQRARSVKTRALSSNDPQATAAKPQASAPSKQPRMQSGYSLYRTRKMQADAEIAEMDRDLRLGKLCDTGTVKSAGAELGTIVRSKIENMADQLAPVVAPETDEAKVHALLVDYGETILTELSQQLAKLGERTEAS